MTKQTQQKPGNFTEQQIRPAELVKGQKVALITDIGRLLTKRKDFIFISCPACNSEKSYPKFEKFGLNYEECSACRTIYITPRPTPDILRWFYRNSENYAYWNKYIFPASEQARRENIMVPRVEEILRYCDKYNVARNSILEVGAGFGTFCEEMQARKGFKHIVGVEPTPDLAQTCRKKGIEVIESPIEKINFESEQLFDVIVNFEVIEHLFSPKDFIFQCKKALKKNGLFFVTCPNGLGFDVITLQTLSKTIDHEHLNYFNPESLKLLLTDVGFEVLEILTPGRLDAELVRNEILAGHYDVSDQPFLKKMLIDEWESLGPVFQQFLSDNLLSSNMMIIAKNE